MLSARTTTRATASTGARAARPTRAAPLVVRASGGGGGSNGDASQFTIPEGATVKVTKPVRIFHAPKAPAEGIALEGLQGKVAKHAAVHKDGRVLSANLPYKVAFELPAPDGGAKPMKFMAHMEADEIEVV